MISEIIGIAKDIHGVAFAQDKSGIFRLLQPGDVIYKDDMVLNLSDRPIPIALDTGGLKYISPQGTADPKFEPIQTQSESLSNRADDISHGRIGTDLLDSSGVIGFETLTLFQANSYKTIDLSSIALSAEQHENTEGMIGSYFADNITGSGSDDAMINNGRDTASGDLIMNGDVLIYHSASEDGYMINGFAATSYFGDDNQGDILNIKDILSGSSLMETTVKEAYQQGLLTCSSDDLNANTIVSVDLDGSAGAAGAIAVATLNGIAITNSATTNINLAEHINI